jgi:hypothetical protein
MAGVIPVSRRNRGAAMGLRSHPLGDGDAVGIYDDEANLSTPNP